MSSANTSVVCIFVGAINETYVANIIDPVPGICETTYSNTNSAHLLSGEPPQLDSEYFKVSNFAQFEAAIGTLIEKGSGLRDE